MGIFFRDTQKKIHSCYIVCNFHTEVTCYHYIVCYKKIITYTKLTEIIYHQGGGVFTYFINNTAMQTNYPIRKYSKWDVINKMYREQFEKVKNYYRNREYAYSNSNELVRLVKTLSRDPRLPVLDYFGYIDTDTKYIVKQFNIVSNLNQGRELETVLFNGISNEIFLYTDGGVDPFTFETNWREYASIRVIKTDITNVRYPVIFRYDKSDLGMSIFEIDVKAMMLQYYYWARERLAMDRDISANVFIPTVVIPNISNNLVDFAIWNRFKALVANEAIDDSDNPKHAVASMDLASRIDDVLKDVIKDNTNLSIHITQLLKTIPTLTNLNMYDTLYINKDFYNKQSKWVLWIARLSDIVFLHKVIGKRGRKLNKDLFNKLPYEIKIMQSQEPMLDSLLDAYTFSVLQENLDYVKKYIGTR